MSGLYTEIWITNASVNPGQTGFCPAVDLPREGSGNAVQPDIRFTPHSFQSPAAGQHPGAM